ncbi:RNase J family beta-CASP ribonuclease [Candidatus Pacearchaeota archaeon]|nr:MAG: RNase J family beta-CASP ribonuclease [Candidatus Pacearchaeota archaeon]
MVKIHTIGGFSEVGKNMVAVELEEDAFLFDQGFFLPAIVSMEERERVLTERRLRSIDAIPDDSVIEKIRHKVCAQFISHAHLDHVGAVPFISDRYNAPIYATPFTVKILESLLKDNDIILKNKVYAIKPNTTFYIRGKNRKYKVDFINITHSTVQCLLIAVHTPKGAIIYGNDFKLDNTPVLGPKPNYKRLREIAKEGVLAIIADSLYSGAEKKTPSERVARAILQEVLLTVQNKNAGMIVTTFSSHIARLKSVVEFGKKLNREVIFLGRSLDKYANAAKNIGVAPFFRDIKISKYRSQVERTLKKIEKRRHKFLVVCTGHQGEPGSILERISRKDLPFKINKEDNIIFSSSVIPAPTNLEQFAKMEKRLKKYKPRIFRDAHVSGHGGREDLRDLIRILSPKHIIPSHGDPQKTMPMADLVSEMGYNKDKQCHIMRDGEVLKL